VKTQEAVEATGFSCENPRSFGCQSSLGVCPFAYWVTVLLSRQSDGPFDARGRPFVLLCISYLGMYV
jgi:hypothetical protein